MEFKKALELMKQGMKMKLPSWVVIGFMIMKKKQSSCTLRKAKN